MWDITNVSAMSNLVKDSQFELISEILKPDAKKRLTLGQALAPMLSQQIEVRLG